MMLPEFLTFLLKSLDLYPVIFDRVVLSEVFAEISEKSCSLVPLAFGLKPCRRFFRFLGKSPDLFTDIFVRVVLSVLNFEHEVLTCMVGYLLLR